MATEVYQHFDRDGELLYVGMTDRLDVRQREHRQHSHWFPQIASTRTIGFTDRELAQCAEAQAIRLKQPKHNVFLPILTDRGWVSRRMKPHPKTAEATR